MLAFHFDRLDVRIPTMVVPKSRLLPVVDLRVSYRVGNVVIRLEEACLTIGDPKVVNVGNSREFISLDMDLWAYQRCLNLDFPRPCKPTDHALIEAFTCKLRSECLIGGLWLVSDADARPSALKLPMGGSKSSNGKDDHSASNDWHPEHRSALNPIKKDEP